MQNDYPRILLYCHNTIGLGHVVRTGTIAQALRRLEPNLNVLVVTGAKRLKSSFFPDNINYVKLPSVQSGSVNNRTVLLSDNLSWPVTELFKLRSELLKTLLANYRPAVLLVDNSPLGLNQELKASLEFCRTELPATKIVLGLRGIAKGLDDAEYFKKFYPVLTNFYDHLLIYTDPQLLNAVELYQLPENLAAKSRYVGYVTRANEPKTKIVNKPQNQKKIVVAAGSGSLGYPVLKAALELTRQAPLDWNFTLSTGLYMSKSHYQELKKLWETLPNRQQVTFTRFVEDFPELLQSADLYIGRGGYNTLVEIAVSGCKALIIPYEFDDLKEQTVNAQLYAKLGLVEILPEAELTADRLQKQVAEILAAPSQTSLLNLNTNGAENTARFLQQLASS